MFRQPGHPENREAGPASGGRRGSSFGHAALFAGRPPEARLALRFPKLRTWRVPSHRGRLV